MSALERILPVRAAEARLPIALFWHGFFAVGSIITIRTVRDTLFLAHAGRSELAWMYVVSAGVVAAIGVASTRYAARVRGDRVAMATAAAAAVVTALFGVAERARESWVYPALYIFAEIVSGLLVMQFWTLVNELFNAREAKRLYGFIGAGGTFASIVLGLAGAKVATRFGASWLLPLAAALMFGTALLARIAGRLGRQRFVARGASMRSPTRAPKARASALRDSGHLRTLALLGAVTYVTITLVDYAFKVVAAHSYPTDHLAAFFSYFSVGVGVLAALLQIFGTSRLLDRLGVLGALAVLPLMLTLGNAALAISATLWAATLCKGADSLLRYSLYDSTTQILYLPVPSQTRSQAKAFIDGVIKPLATGLGGAALVAIAKWGGDSSHIARLSVGLGVIWIALVFVQRRHYIRALQDNLKKPALDAVAAKKRLLEEGPKSAVGRLLESADAAEVRSALAIVDELSAQDVGDKIEALLAHPDELVRVAALQHCARGRVAQSLALVEACLGDERPAVRVAAISTYCAIRGDDAVARARGFVGDADTRIRSAAVAGLLRYGGLEGVEAAVSMLRASTASEDAATREEAARVLGAAGVQNFHQALVDLMSDPNRGVRRAAVAAAAQLKHPDLVPSLIERTRSGDTRHAAIEALSSFGSEAAPALGRALARAEEAVEIRLALARVLARIGDERSLRLLARHLDDSNEELRGRVYRALARHSKLRPEPLLPRAQLENAFKRELARAHQTLVDSHTLALGVDRADGPRYLLGTALAERVTRIEDHAFHLLAVLYPFAEMERIRSAFRYASRPRADAVELLDNLLDGDLKRRFLPLLDELTCEQRLGALDEIDPLTPDSEPDTVLRLGRDDSPWIRACALWYAASRNDSSIDPAGHANDSSALVREVALRRSEGVTKVISTIEKVLVFKSIDLFSQIRGDDLAQIALIAAEERYEPGEDVFAQGEIADALFMIVEGQVRVHLHEREIAVLGPHECFGEMAILDASPRSATVTALSDVALLKISREDFEEIMTENPLISLGIVRVLSRRLRDAIR